MNKIENSLLVPPPYLFALDINVYNLQTRSSLFSVCQNAHCTIVHMDMENTKYYCDCSDTGDLTLWVWIIKI